MYAERVVVKTIDDNKTHRYFHYLDLDVDYDTPIGTVRLVCGYSQDIKKYWTNCDSTIVVTLSLNDEEHNTFIGRVEKVTQKGYTLNIYLQNAGWKFKAHVPKEFRAAYVAGQKVTDAFQAICEGWGLQFCYSIEELNDYSFSTDGYSVQKGGQTIEEAPNEIEEITGVSDAVDAMNQTNAQSSTNNSAGGDELSGDDNINQVPASNTADGQKSSNNNSKDSNSKDTNSNTNTSNSNTDSNTSNSQNTQQTEDDTEELEKKIEKYKKDFEEKIHNLIKGDKIYEDSDVVSSTFDYDAISVVPKAQTATTSTSTPTVATTGTSTTGSSSSNSGSNNQSNSSTGSNSSTSGSSTSGTTNTSSTTSNDGNKYPGSGISSPTTETITVTGQRSCCCSSSGCTCSGTVTHTFYNYCQQCGKTGTLSDNPKGVAEHEITCDTAKGGCGADYCVCCGGCKQNATSCSDASMALIPAGGGGSSTTTSGGGTYIKIPDKTFWGLMTQICGATDSLFIVANNCVYLLQYRDLYNYADKYSKDINTIEKKYIDIDSIKESWSNTGFYNTVIVNDDIKVAYQELVDLYGESVYHYNLETPETKEDGTANSDNSTPTTTSNSNSKDSSNTSNTNTDSSNTSSKKDIENKMSDTAKAIALLSQHVRDYGMGLKFRTLYHPGITVGSFVNVDNPLKITKNDLSKEELFRTNEQKQSDSDSDSKTTDTKSSSKTSTSSADKKESTNIERYFVQGYTMRWNKDKTLSMDVELKYGPDTPDDPINATITLGGSATTGGSGSEGDTCNLTDYGDCTNGHTESSATSSLTVNSNAYLTAGSTGNPTANEYCKIGKANTTYGQIVQNMSAEEVYNYITGHHPYDCYSGNNQASCSESAVDMTCLNCGDMARLLKCCMDVIGVPCYCIHIKSQYGHFANGICVNGQWKTMDGTRQNKFKGSTDTNNCNFPATRGVKSGCNGCG
jgi:hypothetical protein